MRSKTAYISYIDSFLLYFQTGQDCGGGYIKLLSQSKSLDLNKFNDKVRLITK